MVIEVEVVVEADDADGDDESGTRGGEGKAGGNGGVIIEGIKAELPFGGNRGEPPPPFDNTQGGGLGRLLVVDVCKAEIH